MTGKYLMQSLLAFCIALLCSSCAVFQDADAVDAPRSVRNFKTSVKQKAAGEILLKAFVKNDAALFLKQLPEVVSKEFGVNGFKKTRSSMVEQLGEPVAYTYMMNLQHPLFTVSIWRIQFQRKSTDGKKVIRQETLFRAVSGKVDGKERLLGFNFF